MANGQRFEYKKSLENGQWYFSIVMPNNKKVAQSEGYERKKDMIDTIKNIFYGFNGQDSPVIKKAKD